jgi:hypothetical protein
LFLDEIPIDFRTQFLNSEDFSDDEDDVLGDIEEEEEDFGIIQNQMH